MSQMQTGIESSQMFTEYTQNKNVMQINKLMSSEICNSDAVLICIESSLIFCWF